MFLITLENSWKVQRWVFLLITLQFSSVQSLICVRLCDTMDCSMPGLPVHHQLLELTQIHVYRVRDDIQPSHPLLSPSPPAFNLAQHQGLSQWVSSLHQVAKGASASVLPMNIQKRISITIDWFDLLIVQRTRKSIFQHHSSKTSVLQCSAFIVQLSHPSMTTGKTSFD